MQSDLVFMQFPYVRNYDLQVNRQAFIYNCKVFFDYLTCCYYYLLLILKSLLATFPSCHNACGDWVAPQDRMGNLMSTRWRSGSDVTKCPPVFCSTPSCMVASPEAILQELLFFFFFYGKHLDKWASSDDTLWWSRADGAGRRMDGWKGSKGAIEKGLMQTKSEKMSNGTGMRRAMSDTWAIEAKQKWGAGKKCFAFTVNDKPAELCCCFGEGVYFALGMHSSSK